MTTALLENAARATAVKISYGSVAVLLPGKTRMGSPADHTHRWTVFVRGAQNQDISYAVAKVVFTLHESFEQPVRELTAPPFCVSETGWGVFDVLIDVVLRDPAVPPIRVSHPLKLFPDGTTAASAGAVAGTSAGAAVTPVLSEVYDEIVFNSLPADAAARAALLAGPGRDPPPLPHQQWLTLWSDQEDLLAIDAARAWVKERAEELAERLTKNTASKAMLQQALASS